VAATLDQLNHPTSGIQVAWRTKEILIIEDIRKEIAKAPAKRRFSPVGLEREDSGSLICYPVRHAGTNSIPFVFSIHCDQANYFKEDFADVWEHSLERFACRLSLEYSLQLVKEELCNEPN